MRCLTLAQALQQAGHHVTFLCRPQPGSLIESIGSAGFSCVALLPPEPEFLLPARLKTLRHEDWLGVPWQQDCDEVIALLEQSGPWDWVVVDHYALDERWEKAVSNQGISILAIDDLADRPHHCAILLDQTFGRSAKEYEHLVPGECQILTGAEYTMLRPEFLQQRLPALQKRFSVQEAPRNLLISVGAMDTDNYTGRILEHLRGLSVLDGMTIQVVLGQKSPHIQKIRETLRNYPHPASIVSDTDAMGALMLEADVAIGAGGTTTWERCCLGLPTIAIQVAENQAAVLQNLQKVEAIQLCQELEQLPSLLETLITDASAREKLAKNSFLAINGLGVHNVVSRVNARAADSLYLRNATEEDMTTVFSWQTQPGQRQYSRQPSVPTWEEHCTWWQRKRQDPWSYFQIIMAGNTPVGLIRLDPPSKDFLAMGENYASGWEISILIDKHQQGKGYAREALLQMTSMFAGCLLLAEVNPENLPSVKLFENHGFQRISSSLYQRPSVALSSSIA